MSLLHYFQQLRLPKQSNAAAQAEAGRRLDPEGWIAVCAGLGYLAELVCLQESSYFQFQPTRPPSSLTPPTTPPTPLSLPVVQPGIYQVRPHQSIVDYLFRLIQFIVRDECEIVVYAAIFLQRLCRQGISINSRSVHLLLFSCIYLAYKYHAEEKIRPIREISTIAGLSKSHIHQLEAQTLDLLQFSLFVSEVDFGRMKEFLHDLYWLVLVFPGVQEEEKER